MPNPEDALKRVEVEAWINANEKMAVQLTIIAGKLGDIASAQAKVLEIHGNLPIVVTGALAPKLESTASKVERIDASITEIKWLIRTIGAVVGMIGIKTVFQIISTLATGKP